MADEQKWTPGLWLVAAKPSSIVGWPIVSTQMGRVICSLNYVQFSAIDPKVAGDDAFNRESRANGYLIAAAPELFEALRNLAAQAGAFRAFEFEIREVAGNTNWQCLIDAIAQADAALARATGDA